MKYRIIKRPCWWTAIFDTGCPQFLYYDFDLERFEVASYGAVRKHKWIFTKEEIDSFKKDYKNLEEEFIIEKVRDKGDKI